MAYSFNQPTFPEYFGEVIDFLHKHQYVFVHPNTHILSNNVLDLIPTEWNDFFLKNSYLVCNEIASGKISNLMPESLKDFILKAQKLKPIYSVIDCPDANIENIVGVGDKKMHEIRKMAPVIHKICSEQKIQYVVDIGCGLGHLSEFLSQNYGYEVLGLEGNQKLVDTATKKRSRVSYKKLYITENSSDDISFSIKENFKNFDAENDKVCVVALHACADLSVDMLQIFAKISFVKSMILMPCCYHRMQQNRDGFKNFPLSQELIGYGHGFLKQTFLRLGCQRSNAAWIMMDEIGHGLNAKNCLFRNVLQEVVDEENITIGRKKRKTGSKNEDFTIDDFVEKLSSVYSFSKNGEVLEEGHDIISRIKLKVKSQYTNSYGVRAEYLIEAFTSLQMLLQSVCEGVVLMDRCAYVTNSLGFTCDVIKVTDEHLSPRCFAITVTKN